MNIKLDREKLEKMEEHVETMNKEFGEFKISNSEEHESIRTELAIATTDLTWLKKFFWLVAGASIGSFITSIFNLIGK